MRKITIFAKYTRLLPVIKKFIVSFIFLVGLIFLFLPEDFPENFQFQEILNSAPQNEVIIIFNPGGLGNVPLKEAEDFAPIIEGIQETLGEWGLNSIVIPYKRARDDFLGEITAVREITRSFHNQAGRLAIEINQFLKQNPNKKIIVAGLSNGATFVDETMAKISDDLKNNVFAIEIGVPFWKKTLNSENILRLNNEGKDPLSKGEMEILISTFIKAPFKLISAKISGENLSFSKAIHVPGHDYSWDSPSVGPQISTFLKEKFISPNF